MESHKRSKSQMAKSLLARVSSKTDVTREEDSPESSMPPSRTSNVESESGLSQSASSLHPLPHHSTSQRSALHKRHASSNVKLKAPDSVKSTSPSASNTQLTSPPSPSANTLEQSVKLFKIFEALRSGDTAAISKAIRDSASQDGGARVEGTTILHLAIQCAELPVIEFVLSNVAPAKIPGQGINDRDRDGNTPLHIAAKLSRAPVVKLLLNQEGINDALLNYQGQTPLDLAVAPEVFQQLQLARSLYIDENVRKIHELVAQKDYDGLEKLLTDERVRAAVDIDAEELPTDEATTQSGGTLLHEAARKKDHKLIQLLLLNGADPFKRDRKGHLPQNVTKDDRTKAILKKSPAAAAAQRGIQEKTILGGGPSQSYGNSAGDSTLSNKESREMKGYLKKWTNYTSGWKLRWFVLEDGVLSYYKHQDDAGTACRGAINMKIAKLNMDPQDKLRFEIQGKSSVKYHLRANHQVEAKRWYWALNNAIQWSKDEAREEEKRSKVVTDALRQAKDQHHRPDDTTSVSSLQSRSLYPSTGLGVPLTSANASTIAVDEDDPANVSAYEPSVGGGDMSKIISQIGTSTIEADADDDEEYGEDASSREVHPTNKDAFNITAQSVRLQLELLAQVTRSLQTESEKNPNMVISDPVAVQALSAYGSAVGNLKSLVGDILRISKDRDAYWQYRLDREANIRRMWEESMAKVVHEQEQLVSKIGEAEDKRKRTKRALKDALENMVEAESKPGTPLKEQEFGGAPQDHAEKASISSPRRRKSTFVELTGLSEDEDSEDEEFFDAIGSGGVEVVEMPIVSPAMKPAEVAPIVGDPRQQKLGEIQPSFRGYENGVRKRLKMDADDRPKISLWSILKSMIGKDMTKMTLPVSFNEPTSLLQRVAEDMEYTDLIDIAAERLDSTERMVYVAAFAASEYASTIGRVAKPFNPLLGETYEYARPDKGYRFFIEQVSHHPPIGAAWAESPKWDYYGESAVKSKFYGKSFDINPLGTWFLRLRHAAGGEELYTWKKVTSSVVGIITGNPTVDNYGLMEIKNWTTGEVCTLDFKPRGWKASSAYQVVGRVTDRDGKTRWSIGGRWNDKIYARLTPGWEDDALSPAHPSHAQLSRQDTTMNSTKAFLVWEANARPTGIPFNLTPFVVTLNDLNDSLAPYLAPTDTRLRPDQRAMEDGEYDFAATEKNRLEEKQRARRRWREQRGEEFVPRWFAKAKCKTTGEEYWQFNGEYWRHRREVGNGAQSWEDANLEDIFSHKGVE